MILCCYATAASFIAPGLLAFVWDGVWDSGIITASMGGELLILCGLRDGVYGSFKMMSIKIWLDTG